MQSEFWPFLVSSGKYLPHQVIVAPRFLSEVRLSGLLATIAAVREEQTPDTQAYMRLIVAPENDIRNLTAIFRAVQGRQTFLGQGDGILKDEVGRAVVLYEGVVVRGHVEISAVQPRILAAAHTQVLDVFRQFWGSRKPFDIAASDPISFTAADQGEDLLRLTSLPPYKITSPPPSSGRNNGADSDTTAAGMEEMPLTTDLSYWGHALPLHIADCADTRLAPENTLEACELAVRYGADALMVDVRMTRDGEIIAFHDVRLDRTTNGRGRVADYTFEQLRKLDAGYTFTPDKGKTYPYRGQGVTIPSLDMVYRRFPAHLLMINLTSDDARLPQRLWEFLRDRNAERRTLVAGLSRKPLRQFRRIRTKEVTTAASPAELSRWLRARWWHVLWLWRPAYDVLSIPISYYHKRLSPKVFSVAHKSRLGIYLTVDQLADMQQSVDWDIDGIVTNRPDLLEQAFQHLHGDLERLMNRLRMLVALKQKTDALTLARLITARQDTPAEAFQIRAELAEEAGLQAEAREAKHIAKQLRHHGAPISPSA